MSLSLAIALNVIADVALLGGLSWAMTRPSRLKPHVPSARRLVLAEVRPTQRVEEERRAA